MTPLWRFSIDVGGTFTDCLARDPEGRLHQRKVLSSAETPGALERVLDATTFEDPRRQGDPRKFWNDYAIRLPDGTLSRIAHFDSDRGRFQLADAILVPAWQGATYRLVTSEEAPILAIRWTLGLTLEDRLPEMEVRLGTTRGTNSLLTREGAPCALVTTAGFADMLEIGYQDRPELFDLVVRKPRPLYSEVVEITERLTAGGDVLRPADPDEIRSKLRQVRDRGIDSLAICLLHGYRNPVHERLVAQIASDLGFATIRASHQVAPLQGLIARGDTTVVDAFLTPVLKDYIAGIQETLDSSELKLMTSSGGLVDANHFSGKDSILSGPAGGVVGFAQVAEQAGFTRAIGFDMGGTSTDVARYDGRFEYEFETQKAGVRIVSPMLAIETVAAGGGSLCRFDGVQLTVGPASAGADPGPACYGRGGPLAVTDLNVWLGRIPASRFPFPLDRDAIARQLQEQIAEIRREGGPEFSCEALAAGFLEIANANMVRAIRKISVARGYDPRDYVLVAFGGAGGQHACAVARALGIERVLVHPWAGILSAYGIASADIRRFAEQAVLEIFEPSHSERWNTLFRQLEETATRQVLAQGADPASLNPLIRSFAMRYAGTEAALMILEPDDGDWLAAFARRHRQYYGFDRPERDVEVVTARVEIVARTPHFEPKVQPVERRRAEPLEFTRSYLDGQWREVPVFDAKDLEPGHYFEGPAIVCGDGATTVVEPGFGAEVLARGELLLTDRIRRRREEVSDEADPVSLEVFHHQFASIAEQMGASLERTAVSVNVKQRRDFSCAVFTAEGDLVANAPHIPVHLGAMSETVKAILRAFPSMQAGDVFVTNDPFQGGSHLPDVTVVAPVFDPVSGRRLFFTASRAHHAEIGGTVPGSMPPFSTSLAEEGVLLRPFRLFESGESREDVLRRQLSEAPYPSRAVEDNLADVAAQVAANHRGAQLLLEMCDRYGTSATLAYMRHVCHAAEKKMRRALRRLEDGRYSFRDHLDGGAVIAVQLDIAGDEARVDFTGTSDVLPSNLNANRGIVTAALLYVLRCLIDEDLPVNSGVLAPIRLVLPTCLLNPPAHDDPAACAAVAGGNVETSSRVVDVLLGALRLAAASQGTMNNVTFGDGSFGYYETIGGGTGATATTEGQHAVHSHMTNTRLTDPEVLEFRYPVRLLEFAIRRGSGGAGRHRGGDGMVRTFEFLRPVTLSLLTERRGPYPPFGLEGGQPGSLGVNLLWRSGAEQPETLPAKTLVDVQPGDRLTILTPGGGGWGTPNS